MKTLLTELLALASNHPLGRDNPREDLWQALNQTTACLPVYRTYTNGPSIAPEDRAILERTAAAVREHNPLLNPNALAFLQRVLSLDYGADASEEVRTQWLAFVQQWQQITGPVMAKGLEDTALYLYNPHISLNDVGGDPAQSAGTVAAFHHFNQERLAAWPHALNTTSTHDTKRSEDVRARINVLSEQPETWLRRLRRWQRWNAPKKLRVDGQAAPEAAIESLFYQTLLGAWPLDRDLSHRCWRRVALSAGAPQLSYRAAHQRSGAVAPQSAPYFPQACGQ